jgi:hypothetical protein
MHMQSHYRTDGETDVTHLQGHIHKSADSAIADQGPAKVVGCWAAAASGNEPSRRST